MIVPENVPRLLAASNAYHHCLSKKRECSPFLDDPAEYLPVDALGMVMILHGEEFPEDSAFGALRCVAWDALTFGSPVPFARFVSLEVRPGPLQGRHAPGGVRLDAPEHVPALDGESYRRDERV